MLLFIIAFLFGNNSSSYIQKKYRFLVVFLIIVSKQQGSISHNISIEICSICTCNQCRFGIHCNSTCMPPQMYFIAQVGCSLWEPSTNKRKQRALLFYWAWFCRRSGVGLLSWRFLFLKNVFAGGSLKRCFTMLYFGKSLYKCYFGTWIDLVFKHCFFVIKFISVDALEVYTIQNSTLLKAKTFPKFHHKLQDVKGTLPST